MTVAVLFNLLVPVGWKVGVAADRGRRDRLRGQRRSSGLMFWPRGVASVVGDDLADAYRVGRRLS